MALARRYGWQVIWHIHGGAFDQFAASLGPVRKGVLGRALASAFACIVLSPQWLRKLRPYSPNAKWWVIPNGVRIPPRANRLRRKACRFLYLGDFRERKGVLDLVAATELAFQRGFQGTVRIAGGEREPGEKENLLRRISASSSRSQIHMLGTLSKERTEDALASTDCLVLPSYAEGLPMALLEAMAHGVPVIATPVGGVPALVTDGKEGLLVEPGNIEDLADRMVQICNDLALRRRMGRAARHRVRSEYSLNAMVERILELYRGATAGARGHGG
jgi:glycosyltransferase involved in cell wall biosynthesis